MIGLFGEMTYLQSLLKDHDAMDCLDAWLGPEENHHDFEMPNNWAEIKMIFDSKDNVNISSVEQLDSPRNGLLVVYKYHKVSNQSECGNNIKSLISNIIDAINSEQFKNEFYKKLNMIGYQINSMNDSNKYEIVESKVYVVDQSFPCVRRKELPDSIGEVKYELNISGLGEYEL
jgi:hypothetical protein